MCQDTPDAIKAKWWPQGSKTLVAYLCDLTPAELHGIVGGRAITPRLARMLGDASGIPWEAWAAISMGECRHPALSPEVWGTKRKPQKPERRHREPAPYDIAGIKKRRAKERARRKRLRRYIRDEMRGAAE